MVLPLIPLLSSIGSIAGAGGGILSSILGGRAQDEANKTNWAINLYNAQQRERERNESMRYAEKLRGEGKLGATDPFGTKTRFVEGEGWVTELGHLPQSLLDYFIGQEVPEMRAQFEREAATNRSEADVAGQLMKEFQRVVREDPQAIERLLYSVSTRGISEGMEEALGPALLNATRTGQPNQAGDIVSKLGREAMSARRQAAEDAKIQSLDYVDQKYNQQRSGLGQLYNLFAERANSKLTPSVQPGFGIDPSMIGTLSQQSGRNDALGLQAAMMRGGTLNEVEPMLGAATAWGGTGQALAGLGDRLSSTWDLYDKNKLLENYITQGGQLDLNKGGIMELMTERMRGNTGAW